MVAFMPDTIYVLELKTSGNALKALEQSNQRGYATRFQTDGRCVVKAGIHFNTETRTVDEWVIEGPSFSCHSTLLVKLGKINVEKRPKIRCFHK